MCTGKICVIHETPEEIMLALIDTYYSAACIRKLYSVFKTRIVTRYSSLFPVPRSYSVQPQGIAPTCISLRLTVNCYLETAFPLTPDP